MHRPARSSAAAAIAVSALLVLAALAAPAAAAPANLTAKAEAKAGSAAQPKLTAEEEARLKARALALLRSTEAKGGAKAANQAGSANYAPLNTAGRYVATQLVAYKRYRGQAQWDAPMKRRVLGSVLSLFTNAYYRYDMPDSWYRSLTGPTSARSDGRYFQGFKSYRSSNGFNFVRLDGVVFTYRGVPHLYAAQYTGFSMYATINNINFQSGSSSVVEYIVALRRT